MLGDITRINRMLDETLDYMRDDAQSEAMARVDLVWAWGDLMNVLQVFPNMIGLIGLSGLVAKIARGERSDT